MSRIEGRNPAVLDPDFHMDAVICGCHDIKVKTIDPCYLCKSQVKDEQCYKCFNASRLR